jgi:NAD(P)-dependent dehydrogenase (short-subunit alcohol dehydrogenase family)
MPFLDELFGMRGRSVLVTGGSRGIGRMVAEGFVRARATVYITARNAAACDETAAELCLLGQCVSLPGDLSSEQGCSQVAAQLAERTSSLDVLVNNAGATWGAPLEDFPDSAFDKLWAVNVKGPFHLTRLLLPQLRAAASATDPARVIMVGSVDGIAVPRTESYAYSASKAALHMLTRHLAHKLAPERITVNAIAPGLFHSTMTDFAFEAVGQEALSEAIPLGRVGRSSDMAGAALYLSSAAGAYVTGSLLVVDGGLVGTSGG